MGVLDGDTGRVLTVEKTLKFSEPEEGDCSIQVRLDDETEDEEGTLLGYIYSVWAGDCVFTPPDVDEQDLTADDLIQIAQKLRELNKR